MFEISPIADDLDGVVAEARAAAPYLARLLAHKADSLPDAGLAGLEAAFERNLAELRGLGAAPAGSEGDGETLRRVKRRAHLLIALGDLSGNWSLEQVTRALSNLADAAVAAALASALARHDLASSQGLFVFALGKMGARELNYSSDIDLAAFYDPDRFDGGKRMIITGVQVEFQPAPEE